MRPGRVSWSAMTMTTEEPAKHTVGPRRSPRMTRRLAPLIVGVVVAFVSDRLTKLWAESALTEPIDFWPFTLQLSYNPGVAFGLGRGAPAWLIVVIPLVITVGLVVGALRSTAFFPTWAVGLIVGGSLANLFDRIGDRVVTDFLNLGWWPSFNMADSAIVVGAIALLLRSMFAGDAKK